MMNGFSQLNDQIVSNYYINSENSYPLNDSNLNTISECIETIETIDRDEQQLAFEHWNKELHFQCDDSLLNQLNANQFPINNSNQTLINDSLNTNNNHIIDNNSNNYLSFNYNNNNNDRDNSTDSKSKKLCAKLSKKLSRKESANSCRNSKPVSAYALFFRDAQSVIKSSKPSASFGEISKVVAANWEALDVINKNIYKQRADQEKKNYLKSLASSRAKQIAGLMDQSSKQGFDDLQTNTTQINASYDSTQPQSQSSESMAMSANQAFDTNSQQLNEHLMNTSDTNSTAVPKQHCIRSGCGNDAIDSSEWDSEYCSSECCVKHCSDVFQAWVEKQQFSPNNG